MGLGLENAIGHARRLSIPSLDLDKPHLFERVLADLYRFIDALSTSGSSGSGSTPKDNHDPTTGVPKAKDAPVVLKQFISGLQLSEAESRRLGSVAKKLIFYIAAIRAISGNRSIWTRLEGELRVVQEDMRAEAEQDRKLQQQQEGTGSMTSLISSTGLKNKDDLNANRIQVTNDRRQGTSSSNDDQNNSNQLLTCKIVEID